MVTGTTPHVHHYGTVCRLHMIFKLERANTNTQWDGDECRVKIKKDTAPVPRPDRQQSDAGGIGLVPARFRPSVTLHGMYQFLTRIHTYCQYQVYFCCFHSGFIYYCSRGIHQQVITNSESTTSPNRLTNHCLNQYRTTAPCTSIERCVPIANARLYSELIQIYKGMEKDWP